MYIILSFIIFLLILIYLHLKDYISGKNLEGFEIYNIKFLSKKEMKKLIEDDKDYYIRMLSEADLNARKEETLKGYKLKSIKDVTEVKNKDLIVECCKEADNWLKNRNLKYVGKDHKLDEMKWIIGITKGYYEEGFPHTRGRIILLSSNIENKNKKTIIATLIHEKLHIYVRYNREKVLRELEILGYTRDVHNSKEYLIRANPDTDEWLYKNPSGERMMFKYNNEEPKSITDGKIFGGNEHPYEMISYEIENDFLQDKDKDE